MSGQPPVMPPSLSYKSKAQREQDEREKKEREEAERLAQEQYEARMAEVREQEEAERKRSLLALPTSSPGAQVPEPPTPTPSTTPTPSATPSPTTEPTTEPAPAPAPAPTPVEDDGPRPSVQDPKSLVMFNEDGVTPVRREIDDIEMLGGPEEKVEEVVEEEEEEVEEVKERFPPRPPKSPDMRPVAVGFILVFTGLTQFVYGVWTMIYSPDAASGPWSPIVKWGTFSMGFSAAFLGLLAIRGGLWSFRKERFSVVKAGAIAATVCVWAWWVPWLFGLAALILATRSREEYYPFYNPQWDAPEYARPPPRPEDEEGTMDESEGEEVATEDDSEEPAPRDYLDDVSPEDTGEGSSLQDAALGDGDGWEDID